jgi:Zn-dependent protease with chaperone function
MEMWIYFFIFIISLSLIFFISLLRIFYKKKFKLNFYIFLKRYSKRFFDDARLILGFIAPFVIFQLLQLETLELVKDGTLLDTIVNHFGRIILISFVTITISVSAMLVFIPTQIIEMGPQYDMIKEKLTKIGFSKCHLRWINVPHFKNAFVVGFSFLGFSNQTLFIGKSLRQKLSKDEFEAVISHEIGHIFHRHSIKRIFISCLTSIVFFLTFVAVAVLMGLIGLDLLGLSILIFQIPIPLIYMLVPALFIALIFSSLTSLASFFSFLRFQELKADQFAINHLNINPDSLISALSKLSPSKPKRKFNFLHQIFSTHPTLEKRFQKIKTNDLPDEKYKPFYFPDIGFGSYPVMLTMSFLLLAHGIAALNWLKYNDRFVNLINNKIDSPQEVKELVKWGHSRSHVLFGHTLLQTLVMEDQQDKINLYLDHHGKFPGLSDPDPIGSALVYNRPEIFQSFIKYAPQKWLAQNQKKYSKIATQYNRSWINLDRSTSSRAPASETKK